MDATDGMGGRADEVYEAILAAHRGLNATQSTALNARRILLLANLANNPEGVLAAVQAASRNF